VLVMTTDLNVDYEVLGIVRGNRVRAAHLGRDIMAGLKNLVGGDVSEYADLMSTAREAALEEMKKEAKRLGANAVVGLRFATSSITQGMSEIMAYGTAVKI